MTLSATYGAKVWEIALSTNRVGEVVTFLLFGIKDVTISVKFVEQQARAYRPDELKALFAAADPEE